VSLNSRLFVSNDSSLNGNLAVSKNIIGQGTLNVTGLTSLNEKVFVTNDVSLNSRLFVSADSSLNGNLAVSKNIIGQGTLNVTGVTSLNEKVFVIGDVSLNSRLFVSADSSLNGNLAVSKNIVGQETLTVTGLTSLNEKLFVTNDVSLNSRLFVSADSSLNGNLAVSKNIIGQGTLTVTGVTSLNNQLLVTGDVSLNSKLFITGDVSLNSKLFVVGDASLNSRLFVSNDVSINGNLAVSKNIIGQGTLTVTGNTSLNSRLTVTNETTLNAGLGVASDSSFNNKLFVAGNLTVGTSGAPSFVGIGMDPSSNYTMNVSGTVNATGGVFNNGTVIDGPTGMLSNDVYENYCSAFSIINNNEEITRVSMSSDGKYITMVGPQQGYPLISSDYGKTFQQITTDYFEVVSPNIEMSANGKFQYYVSLTINSLLRSSDYGNTWTALLADAFADVAVSSSGQYVVLTRSAATLLSNDYGITFTTLPGLPTNVSLKNNAISSSGQIIIVTYTNGVYVSTNFGISWKQIVLSGSVFSNVHLSMSSTGQYIIVIGSNSSKMYTSTDYGATFVSITGLSITPSYSYISANGQYQIISHTTGMVSSVDYGKTWISNTNYIYRGIAMTSNGRIVVSATSSGAVMSTNYSTEFADRFKYDVSLNARLSVALDSSFNSKLFISGNVGIGAGTSNTPYKLDVCGNMRIFESVGTRASATAGSLIFEHADVSGVSSIMFKSKNAADDYAYIQYEENGGNGNSGVSEKGVLTLGIENDPTLNTIKDTISLYPAAGQGFVGINTKGPVRNLDVSGGMAVSGDVSLNSTAFVKYLTNSFIVSTGVSPGLTVTFPISRSYLLTDAAATNVIITLPTLPTSTETYIVTFKRTVYSVSGSITFNTGGATANTQLIYPSQTSMLNGALHTQLTGNPYTYTNTGAGTHQFNAITLMGVNNGTVVGWFEI